jgi:hypothetical protein
MSTILKFFRNEVSNHFSALVCNICQTFKHYSISSKFWIVKKQLKLWRRFSKCTISQLTEAKKLAVKEFQDFERFKERPQFSGLMQNKIGLGNLSS